MISLKKSKSITQLKKGDKVKVDGHDIEVFSHQLFMDHKTTKEMIIDLFNPKTEKKYQIRYFDDQVDTSIEFYYLQGGFEYSRVEVKSVEW